MEIGKNEILEVVKSKMDRIMCVQCIDGVWSAAIDYSVATLFTKSQLFVSRNNGIYLSYNPRVGEYGWIEGGKKNA